MVEPSAAGPAPESSREAGGTENPDFLALIDDQRARWLRGEPVMVEEYLSRDPALWTHDETILDLIYNEVLLREEVGEAPRLDEYQQRFPRWAGRLEAQFDEHRAISQATHIDAGVTPTPPPPEPVLALPPAPAPLPRIPGYEVISELGRGGMGVVYFARQVRLNRPCALKTILAGDHAPPEAIIRFLGEAETVARLRHPSIVQIHAIGDHDGRPYIELEYIEGGSLASRLDGTPWAPLRAAELVETVARGIHEVHLLGIVHRDLKPANILLAADGTPKLTDFGLAKSMYADSGLTRTDSILGSPSYMAPEQASGRVKEVGPAADIYALGAILYELLTGRAPFRAATLFETLEQVQSVEPVPPSRLQPGLPRDLQTIVLKCLEKDPSHRYGSPRELADDLGRYRRGESIRARPAGPIERGLKWMKRRPLEAALLGITGLALLSLTWAIAASTYDRHLEKKNRALDAALLSVEQERTRARRSFDQARAVIDHFIAQIEERLDEPQLKPVRDELLADGLAYYQSVLKTWEDSPELQLELIHTYTGAARVAESLGSREEARKAYEEVLDLLDKLVRRYPGATQYRLELAEAQYNLGRHVADTGKVERALGLLEASRSLQQQLLQEQPGDPHVLAGLARSHGAIGDLLLAAGRIPEAQAATLESQRIRQTLAQAQPRDAALQFKLARSFASLAGLNRQLGRPGDARDNWQQAIRLAEPLDAGAPALREYRGDLAWSCCRLGSLLLEAEPPATAEAQATLNRARTLAEKLLAAHPGVPDYQWLRGITLVELARAGTAPGEQASPLDYCQQARDLFERLVQENPGVTRYLWGLARSSQATGALLTGSGRGGEAEPLCRQACEILGTLVENDPRNLEYQSQLGQAYSDDARALVQIGRHYEAAERLRRAVEAHRAATTGAPKVALFLRRLDADSAALAKTAESPE
jgi:tetratricopeptide (TPR) repeat protein